MSEKGRTSITFKNPVGVNNRNRAKELFEGHIDELKSVLAANEQFKRDSDTNRGFLKSNEAKKVLTIVKNYRNVLK